MNTFEFALDLSKQTAMEPLRLRQGDKNGTEVRATIYDHGTLVTGSYTSRICLSLPDGEHYYRKAGTFSAGVATVTIDEQEAASVVGRSYGYIQLLSGSTVIASTASFPVLVLPDATADATVPESYDTAIQEAIDGLNEAVADLPDTVEEILEQHHEWTTTVQDNSVTDAKLIQSGGILSRNARLMYRLANLLTHRTDEGTLAAISDAAKTPVAGLSVYGLSTQDGTPTPSSPVPIVSVEPDSEGNISLKAQGLNWLDTSIARSSTNKGITVSEPDANGWLTISGTSTATSSAVITMWGGNDARIFPPGVYTLLLETEGTAFVDSKVRLQVYGVRADTSSTFMTNAGTYTMDYTENGIDRISIHVASSSSGVTVNGRFRLTLVSGTTAPTAYIPYAESVTPIDLDGHELRSLPDGTRDELTVDAEGHVTLVQRVVSVDLGTLTWTTGATTGGHVRMLCNDTQGIARPPARNNVAASVLCARYVAEGVDSLYTEARVGIGLSYSGNGSIAVYDPTYSDAAAFKTAMSGTEFVYPLATPVTHDLGTVPLVPLVGPDLTAQTVPTAPFVLDAERDLNVTLARLESAIAALA